MILWYLFLHRNTWYDSHFQKEYVSETCLDSNPGDLYDWRALVKRLYTECINLNMNDFRLPAATERTNLNLSDLQLPVSSQIIMRAQKLYNSSQIWTLCVYSWIWATSGWLFLHKWTWDGNGCQRKYVLATCAALNPDIIMIKGLDGCWDKTSG